MNSGVRTSAGLSFTFLHDQDNDIFIVNKNEMVKISFSKCSSSMVWIRLVMTSKITCKLKLGITDCMENNQKKGAKMNIAAEFEWKNVFL